MYYGADQAHSYRRVAYYLDRLLKGAKPADPPVEQPTKFDFIINLKAAKQNVLTIMPNVLVRAIKIIRRWQQTKLRCQDWTEFSLDSTLEDLLEASFSSILTDIADLDAITSQGLG
jgi:hypothetical protein